MIEKINMLQNEKKDYAEKMELLKNDKANFFSGEK